MREQLPSSKVGQLVCAKVTLPPQSEDSRRSYDHFYRAFYDLAPVMMHSMDADGTRMQLYSIAQMSQHVKHCPIGYSADTATFTHICVEVSGARKPR